jgi:AcrR family transcriptional regulator
MRKSRDGEATKGAVLSAAKDIFAERGYSGTSLAMISEKCGISDGLILHHYKSKKNLYHEVLKNLAGGYVQTIQEASKNHGPYSEIYPEMFRATFKFWSEDTQYNRISLWAYLEDQSELIEEETKLTASLAGMLEQLQQQGLIDTQFAPFVLLTMTIGPIHFWIRYRDQFKKQLKLEGSIEELNKIFLDQFIDLIKKCYRPTGA